MLGVVAVVVLGVAAFRGFLDERERSRPPDVERRLLRREELDERAVGGLDRSSATRGIFRRIEIDMVGHVPSLDAVHRVEHGRMHDGEDASRRRRSSVRGFDGRLRVLVPVGHHVRSRRPCGDHAHCRKRE